VNALVPGLHERVGAVSEALGTGKHTTTWATIFDLPDGSLVDTPGLEYFTAWGVTPTNLKEHFLEFVEAAEGCKFRDCQHMTEPKCAVLERLRAGRIAASRYENYREVRRLLDERRSLFDLRPGS
jgi:ribosome biogenesis GTPase